MPAGSILCSMVMPVVMPTFMQAAHAVSCLVDQIDQVRPLQPVVLSRHSWYIVGELGLRSVAAVVKQQVCNIWSVWCKNTLNLQAEQHISAYIASTIRRPLSHLFATTQSKAVQSSQIPYCLAALSRAGTLQVSQVAPRFPAHSIASWEQQAHQ